jgi:ubiquinone/menaquinone biosynthesis C-methylase UbiE
MQTPPVCDYEGSDYQQSFWDAGGRAYEDQVEAVALQRLLPPTGELLLELGAGAGRNTPRYAGYQRVVVLDYSLTQLQQAQARLGRSERYIYVAANIYRLPFARGLFDAATMIRVLHHMADAPLALQQVHASLRRNAVFVLEFANKQNLKAILRYWLKRQDWSPFTPEPVEFVELNYDFHPAAVRGWLQSSGFVIRRQLTVSHFRIGILKRLFPTRLLVTLDSLAQQTGDLWQLTPSVFVGAQAAGDAPAGLPEAFFCCPDCGIALPEVPATTQLVCPACEHVWPIRDGIYDFRDRPESPSLLDHPKM